MGSMVGTVVMRKEDPALLTGRGTYVDDVQLSGTVHMAYVRSYLAHARIVSIDTTGAAAMPGVLGVWTHDDLPGCRRAGRCPGWSGRAWPPGRSVRRECVAVVVATDKYAAADAAGAVEVEYEELPVAATVAAATAEGATPIMDGLPSNVVLEQTLTASDAEPSWPPRRTG
jgi:carbon-monoxide dehydrogenase large subunit